jgi:trimethylamine:corrinoid methyltransferase-like protein
MEKVKRDGFMHLQDAAKEMAKKILKEHQVTPLDKDVERDLDMVVKEAERKLLR